MIKEKYLNSVESCLNWISSQMLTFNNGFNGIYERIRIDENIRTNMVRPDCNAEVARVMALYRQLSGNEAHELIFNNITEWLLRTQDNDELSAWYGGFTFFLADGYLKQEHPAGTLGATTLFQNDNGKTLVCLIELYRTTGDKRFLTSAEKLANFWVGIQRPDGTFFRKDGRVANFPKGPCFVQWLAVGLIMCYKEMGNEIFKSAAYKAFEYLLENIMSSGRMKTSYELEATEDWRPVSSEAAIALYTFSKMYEETGDEKFLAAIDKTGEFLISLQHERGGILNCNDACADTSISLQNNKKLCDLVYTQGYALMALVFAWRSTGDEKYHAAAIKLADFLVEIQCKDESPLWDGAWRGSFNVETWEWDGRANQNNPVDEGGMYSVYTGWCAAPVLYGLLLLA